MHSSLDDSVGRLMRALDEQHLAEDTIVVFTSDYGDMLGFGTDWEGAKRSIRGNPCRVASGKFAIRGQIEAGRQARLPADECSISCPLLAGVCAASQVRMALRDKISRHCLPAAKGPHPESVYCLGKTRRGGRNGEMVVRRAGQAWWWTAI